MYSMQALIATLLIVLITITPAGSWLESTLIGHILIEIPILILIGIWIGTRCASYLESYLSIYNRGGIPGILLAALTMAFWMIPRWLDASLADVQISNIKYASLILFVGVPLSWSWSRLHPIANAVVKIEFLTMLFRLGWLYLISPDRLCNNYLMSDQIWLGRGFLWIAIALSITWLFPVFFGNWNESSHLHKSRT